MALSNIAMYGENRALVGQVGAGALLKARTAIAQTAADAGFDVLQMCGSRGPGSSALKPGTFNWTIDLSRYR